jgi:hypothetical protein
MNRVLAGLQIFAIYDPDFDTCAEHDVLYVISKKIEKELLPAETLEQLDSFGWRYSDDLYCAGWEIFT